MKINRDEDRKRIDPSWLHADRFPRTSGYELDWVLANEMGPNALWLMEELVSRLDLEPGQRVLDMGSGRAMTSVFLARELGLRVWANDLWVSPDDSWKLICEAGQQGSVCPIRAEAHDLPYAAGFFDAVLSVDSYQYYGTDDIYLGYITRFLAPGGTLGLVMPALMQEIESEPPEHLTRPGASGTAFWDPRECWCFHTAGWWRRHLERTGLVDVEVAENVKDGWRLWRDWELIRNGGGFSGFPSEAETLDADRGEYIGFVLLIARRCAASAEGLVDHSLRLRL